MASNKNLPHVNQGEPQYGTARDPAVTSTVQAKNPHHATRRNGLRQAAGYTLLETLITLSLLTTLAVASVTIINSLTQEGIESAHSRQSRRDIHRIANFLRDDAARTTITNTGTLAWPVTLPHDSSQTVYDWNEADSTLTRTETAGEQTTQTERFLLPKGSEPQMNTADALLTLQVTLTGGNMSWIIEGMMKQGESEQ